MTDHAMIYDTWRSVYALRFIVIWMCAINFAMTAGVAHILIKHASRTEIK